MSPTPPAILVDRRIGSAELAPVLEGRRVPTETVTLPFGDFAFVSRGPTGDPVTLGIERKRIRDFIQSIETGRLAGHQLPGLVEYYDYRWLVIEGPYRLGRRTGQVEIPIGKGRWKPLWSSLGFARALLTLELRGGLMIRETANPEGTAHFLESLWGWWTQKTWAEHRAHLALQRPPDLGLFRAPPLVERVASLLEGVGGTRARAVAQQFRCVRDLVDATEAEWTTIPGIGKTIAQRVHQSLRIR